MTFRVRLKLSCLASVKTVAISTENEAVESLVMRLIARYPSTTISALSFPPQKVVEVFSNPDPGNILRLLSEKILQSLTQQDPEKIFILSIAEIVCLSEIVELGEMWRSQSHLTSAKKSIRDSLNQLPPERIQPFLEDISGNLSFLKSILLKLRSEKCFQCPICADFVANADKQRCHGGHTWCVQCLKRLLETSEETINDLFQRRTLRMRCFYPDCEHALPEHYMLQTGVPVLQRLSQDLQQRRELINNAGHREIVECPVGRCVGVGYRERNTVMCFICTEQWQDGYVPGWIYSFFGRIFGRSVGVNGTKPCPQCGQLIQKDGGCDHMHCTACDHHFYWTTLLPYRR